MEADKIVASDGGTSAFANGASVGAMLGKGGSNNDALMSMLAGMQNSNQWNNPFIYLVWMMFANQWMRGQGVYGGANTGTQAQIQALQNVVQDNHNSDLLMQAVNGNTQATQQLAGALNARFDQVNAAICGVRNGITEANGNIQLAAQQMISNNNLQSAALGTQIGAVGNQITREILTQGYQGQFASQAANYQNQIGNLQQSSLIQQLSQQLQNTMQSGFTQIGFQSEKNSSAIQQNSTANTQRIIDTLTNHWNLEQQTTIQQLRDEVGRLNQSNQLIAALKGTATATSTTNA